MQNVVHINQFYNCSKVEFAIELQYIVELGKYLHYNGEVLSLNGVILDKLLRKSRYWDYFRVAVDEGWIIDVFEEDLEITQDNPVNYDIDFRNILITENEVKFDKEDHERRLTSSEYKYRTPLPMQIYFTSKNDVVWDWTLKANSSQEFITNNKCLNSDGAETCWVSFIAYVGVQRLLTGCPERLTITINGSIADTPDILSNFLLLLEETSCCNSWCFYHLDKTITEKRANHLGYLAWYKKGQELGYLNGWYNSKEKLEYMDKLDIKVGDVVYLYERHLGPTLNYVKEIAGFKLAVVKGISTDGIDIQIINTKKTKAQGEVDYKNYTMATKQMYGFDNPFNRFNSTRTRYKWNDIGVEYLLYSERYFITPCYDDDMIVMNISNSYGDTECVYLSACNLTYYILKDFDVEFNEERFLARYFGGKKPLLTYFEENRTVPENLVYKGE